MFTEVINLDICCHPATISNIYLSRTAPVSKVVTLSRLEHSLANCLSPFCNICHFANPILNFSEDKMTSDLRFIPGSGQRERGGDI